jgi:hypothetical protein
MAELKTKKTAVNVDSFLNAVADARQREDSFRLVELMKEITGEEPKMWGPSIVGFGEYHYVYESGHEGDMCLTGFSPRKGNFVLYAMNCLYPQSAAQIKKLGKVKATKGCLYIKKLADVDLKVLREMIEGSIQRLANMPKPVPAKKPRKKS